MPDSNQNLGWLEDEILRSIRRIVRAIEMYSQSLINQVGLTSPQLAVLKAVQRLDPATPTSIARDLRLSQPTVSGILERLSAKRLLQRETNNDDKRMRTYHLTEESTRLIQEAPPLLQEDFQQRLAQLQDWERSMLLSALQRVAGLMDAEGLEAQPILIPGLALLGSEPDR